MSNFANQNWFDHNGINIDTWTRRSMHHFDSNGVNEFTKTIYDEEWFNKDWFNINWVAKKPDDHWISEFLQSKNKDWGETRKYLLLKEKHERYLKGIWLYKWGEESKFLRKNKIFRGTYCWKCKNDIQDDDCYECNLCWWIVCPCGACWCSQRK